MNTLKQLKSKKNKYLKLLKILENNIKDCKKQNFEDPDIFTFMTCVFESLL